MPRFLCRPHSVSTLCFAAARNLAREIKSSHVVNKVVLATRVARHDLESEQSLLLRTRDIFGSQPELWAGHRCRETHYTAQNSPHEAMNDWS
jgi:hypothetical protein